MSAFPLPVLSAAIALLPVLLFLIGLTGMDSYRLLRLPVVVRTILVGGMAGGAAYLINSWILSWGVVGIPEFSRYGSPLIEEGLKGLFIVYLIRSSRVGFLVDAGILGFAVGSGFALVENIYFLLSLTEPGFPVWFVRGCGVAMMHGGCTAIFAIVSKARARDAGESPIPVFLPGFLIAAAIHSFFNHFFLSPLVSSALILILLPVLTVLTFQRSEEALRGWLGSGFDRHVTLLRLIHSGDFQKSRIGRYLQALRQHFSGEEVVDMLCYIRLQTELSLQAKGLLMAREKGFDLEPDKRVTRKLAELKHLEAAIGKTGKLAIAPIVRPTAKDVWQLELLKD